jgi:hypothetical protein
MKFEINPELLIPEMNTLGLKWHLDLSQAGGLLTLLVNRIATAAHQVPSSMPASEQRRLPPPSRTTDARLLESDALCTCLSWNVASRPPDAKNGF